MLMHSDFKMFLLLWGSLLSLSSTLVAPISKLLVSLTCNITEYELELRRNLKEVKADLAKISMMDEFAQYAKTERKINKLTEKLSQCSSARSLQASKASWAFTLSMHACLGLSLVMTMWSWGSEPVLLLPQAWLSPISWPLSMPTGVPGGISLPIWMGLNSAVIKVLPKLPSPWLPKEYSQLPLD